ELFERAGKLQAMLVVVDVAIERRQVLEVRVVVMAHAQLGDDVVQLVLAEDLEDLDVPLGVMREASGEQVARGLARVEVVFEVRHRGWAPPRAVFRSARYTRSRPSISSGPKPAGSRSPSTMEVSSWRSSGRRLASGTSMFSTGGTQYQSRTCSL